MPASLFLLILILVALNLRPALSSLAPLLDRITQDLGLSTLAAGLLTTLPVVCLGLFAPLAPRLARRLGVERTLSLALVTLGIALWLRASDMALLLYLGTLLCGGSIGVAGTLLPAIVKREHPERADLFTGVYTMALCL
ncbi:MFS transporter, partial [uncultured Cobetia sp.]